MFVVRTWFPQTALTGDNGRGRENFVTRQLVGCAVQVGGEDSAVSGFVQQQA